MKQNGTESLYFSSLQSPFATHFLETYSIKITTSEIPKTPKIDFQQLTTIYFYEDGKLYQKSEAILHIAKHLNKPWKYFSVFSFLPTALSNKIYEWVSKNRYRWFGKNSTCRIPTAAELKRFVEA